MSFRIVRLLRNSQAFDLEKLVHCSIDLAAKSHTVGVNQSHDAAEEQHTPDPSGGEEELTEIILFVAESVRAHPECISPSDISQLIEGVCYRVMQQSDVHIHKQGQQRSHNERLIQAVYMLCAAVLQALDGPAYQGLKARIQRECSEGLQYFCEEQRLLVNLTTIDHEGDRGAHIAALSIKDILGVLDHTFDSIRYENVSNSIDDSWLMDCFQSLVDILEFGKATMCSHISGILLPKFLKSLLSDRLQEQLAMIWVRLYSIHKSSADRTSQQTSNVYVALCGLSEFYIPLVMTSPTSELAVPPNRPPTFLPAEDGFWRVIQSGLVHTDPLARKQACFLMKRSIETASANNLKISVNTSSCNDATSKKGDAAPVVDGSQEQTAEPWSCVSNVPLFWWSPEAQKKLVAVWADFFLLYETLDEVQVHVVTPVMPRLKSLIQAASNVHSASDSRPFLHTSWLTILFSRCFVHESKTVLQWGLLQYLRLDNKSCPLLQQVGTEFLFASVLPTLNDGSLYAGQSTMTISKPPIAEAFSQFMRNCIEILGTHHCKVFLREFILAVSRQSWNPVSLTFVFDMLVSLPESSAWGASELQLLREMQFSCLSMMSGCYRSVMQCLMLQAVLRLLDKDGTSLQQLSGLFWLFNKCLHRESPLWKQVCDWLEANKHTQLFGSGGDVVAVLHSEVATLLTSDPSASSSTAVYLGDIAEPSRVACLVLLAADAHYANMSRSDLPSSGYPPGETSFLQSVLVPLTPVLATVGSHIYLPITKADTALQLLHSILLHLIQPRANGMSAGDHKDPVRQEMTVLLTPYLEDIFSFVARQVLSAELAEATDVSRISLYISVLESICTFLEGRSDVSSRHSVVSGVLSSGRTRLVECCKVLTEQSIANKENAVLSQFQAFVACRLLLWLLQIPCGLSGSLKLSWDTLLPLVTVDDDTVVKQAVPDASSTTILRKISNLLLCTKWQCIRELLGGGSGAGSPPFPSAQPHDVILAACVRDLALVKGPDAVPVMQCAKILVNKVHQEAMPLCLDLVATAWSVIQDEWRSKAHKFWLVYSTAVELIFQHCFLVAEKGTQMHEALNEIIQNILTLGEGKPKIVTVFVRHLCRQWASRLHNKEASAPTMGSISNYLPPLMEMCVMGSRVSRDVRLQQDISVYLQGLPHLQAVRDDITACVEQRSCQRRIILLNFLLQLATMESPECCQIITDFVQGLMRKFLEMKTTTRRGYLMNTQLHRQIIRLWQTLLVLVPHVQKECAGQILEDVLRLVVSEKQSSVRHLMVWVAIQLVILEPCLEEIVWDLVQKLSDASESNICPVLILITHLGTIQPDTERKESFYRRAFPVLLPWTLVRTSSIKHLSLLCVKKAWQHCSQEGLDGVLESFPLLQACMTFLQNGPAAPSQNKVDSNFFLFKVHPVQDYTIQTVFHVLPALCSLAEDEFLEPELFEKDCPSLWSFSDQQRSPLMYLYNSKDSAIQEQYCLSLSIRSSSVQEDAFGTPTKLVSAESRDSESDVQKKVIPWQDTLMPGFEDVMRTAGQDEQGAKGSSLVLVASLIDKAPNLGGLCRTCQVFGVSTYVINSLNVITDKVFQSLSVTAEKWVPIVEVPASDLATYLQGMRHKGYTLIGAEQTARSQCLTRYKFPERTLLLLGNERTGIPVELIQLLDVCVEIPQQGVIRSLNVHVSGALLVWEYTRQRLLAQTTKE